MQLSLHIISSCVLWAVYTSHRNAKTLGMLRHPLVCGLDKPVNLNYITQVTFITADSAHATYVSLIGLGWPHTQAPSQLRACMGTRLGLGVTTLCVYRGNHEGWCSEHSQLEPWGLILTKCQLLHYPFIHLITLSHYYYKNEKKATWI